MENLSLRYYKKPKKKNFFKLQKTLKKNNNVFLILLILGALLLVGFIYSIFFSISPQVDDISEYVNNESGSYYYSEKGPFYAQLGTENIISNKIDNKWIVNLGSIDRNTKVGFGRFHNFILFSTFLSPEKFINITPKYNLTNNYKIDVKDQYNSSVYEFTIGLNEDKRDFILFNKEIAIYNKESPSNSCVRELNPNQLKCKLGFVGKGLDFLDLDLVNADKEKLKILRNKIVYYTGSVMLNCQILGNSIAGQNTMNCNPTKKAIISIQNKEYDLKANEVVSIPIDLKSGENIIEIKGRDEAENPIAEVLKITVEQGFYLDFAPAKDKFPIEEIYNLEFILNSSEDLKIEIASSAKESTKGYKQKDSAPIDTDFTSLLFEKKTVEFDANSNSLVFQVDGRSNKNNIKENLYSPIISLTFSIESKSGKKALAECKAVIDVSTSLADKSSCIVRYLNNI
ncbi:MAG: hypothetical protein ACRCXZ_00315 [Patescibacteria group bacterium]